MCSSVPDGHPLNTLLQMWTLGPRTEETCLKCQLFKRREVSSLGCFLLETAEVLVLHIPGGWDGGGKAYAAICDDLIS